jgi:hypothetical protein
MLKLTSRDEMSTIVNQLNSKRHVRIANLAFNGQRAAIDSVPGT